MNDDYEPLLVAPSRRFVAFLGMYLATVGPFLAAVLT